MYEIQSNLKQLLRELEAKNQKDYEIGKVAKAAGLSRFTVSMLANNNHARTDFSTLAKLLWFFKQEGMTITLNDLFTVTDTSERR